MNKEEKEFFYSIGRGILNLNGKLYYGLDYSITDFINSLEQENKQLKEVIEEVREYILNHELVEEKDHYVLNGNELLQILDKAKYSDD